jgi:hypothetical protein
MGRDVVASITHLQAYSSPARSVTGPRIAWLRILVLATLVPTSWALVGFIGWEAWRLVDAVV